MHSSIQGLVNTSQSQNGTLPCVKVRMLFVVLGLPTVILFALSQQLTLETISVAFWCNQPWGFFGRLAALFEQSAGIAEQPWTI